jgi:hypothetical protein
MKPEKSLAGDERRQAAVVIMCWIVGRAQRSTSSGRGVFLREVWPLVGSVRDSNTPADEGFGGKGETGFGCLRRASQRTAGSVRLGQGLCFGYAPVAWVGGVGRSLPLDAYCRLPMAKRIGRRRKDFPRGVGAGDGVEDGARKQQIGCDAD